DEVKGMMKLAGGYMKGVKSLDVEVKEVKRRGFKAKRVEVRAMENYEHRKGIEVKEALIKCAESHLNVRAKKFAVSVMDTLIEAESKVHGEYNEDVHLHELGSVDTVVDIIGTAFCLERLNLLDNVKIYSTPVALGGGTFRSSEGIIASPSPAVLEILKSKRFLIVGGPIASELCTPTGASILVNIAEPANYYPLFKPSLTGYGAGSEDFAEIPNILRISLGEMIPRNLFDEVFTIETNLDDISGEVIGHAMDKLMEKGAKSVSLIPIYTKGNRPGQIIQVITDSEHVENLSRVLMEETGTLGVRIIPYMRHILSRDFSEVKFKINDIERSIRVKIARDEKGKIIRIKAEYEDARRIANEVGLPLWKVLILAEEKARSILKGEMT
ncbi:MAG: nickel pincer cofactor biosynthesis protein LarC, partial [Candidatus Methylarchaceae archaeon HK02M2]|nr:nickel pincer cofactor biosynthesis protein LarC [Candidatus Methylarchaceae archaeon HK02M2]